VFGKPLLEAGEAPVVEVYFVEAGAATVVKVSDDVAVGAAGGKHGVKVVLNLEWEPGDFAARFGNLNGSVKVWVCAVKVSG